MNRFHPYIAIRNLLVLIVLVFFIISVNKQPVNLFPKPDSVFIYKASYNKTTNKMLKVITDTIWCEDRSTKSSMEKVLSVIYNRANTKTIENIYNEAIKPYQFSCNNEKSTIKTQKVSKLDQIRYDQAIQLVDALVNRTFKPTTDAKFFYAHAKIAKPIYLDNKTLLIADGGHLFYK